MCLPILHKKTRCVACGRWFGNTRWSDTGPFPGLLVFSNKPKNKINKLDEKPTYLTTSTWRAMRAMTLRFSGRQQG